MWQSVPAGSALATPAHANSVVATIQISRLIMRARYPCPSPKGNPHDRVGRWKGGTPLTFTQRIRTPSPAEGANHSSGVVEESAAAAPGRAWVLLGPFVAEIRRGQRSAERRIGCSSALHHPQTVVYISHIMRRFSTVSRDQGRRAPSPRSQAVRPAVVSIQSSQQSSCSGGGRARAVGGTAVGNPRRRRIRTTTVTHQPSAGASRPHACSGPAARRSRCRGAWFGTKWMRSVA